VQAPHYGDTLFHFYQDRYFSAITGLMVSQHFGRVAPHDDEAEVLRGGMLLSYGLHQQAAEVFAQLIDRQAAPAVRDRAWFFLARIRHQRELLDASQEALDRIAAPSADGAGRRAAVAASAIDDGAPGPCRRRRAAARPQGQSRPRASTRASTWAWPDPRRQRERGQGLAGRRGPRARRQRRNARLRDRANLALGFAALQAEEPREARAALQRVRLNAQQSNKALLGFGWAATALKDPQLALVPFTELAGRSPADSAVLEAQIALPYAMAEFGAYSRALEGYQQAVTRFGSERQRLQASHHQHPQRRPGAGLLAHNPGEAGLGAFSQVENCHPCRMRPNWHRCWPGMTFSRPTATCATCSLCRPIWRAGWPTWALSATCWPTASWPFAQKLPAVRAQSGAINLPALQQRYDTLAAD
jgi:tetratricopeptide (TPR) repeat protein